MSRVFIAQPVTNDSTALGMELMLEASRRLPKASSGFVRADCGDLLREASRDAHYCIDAPEGLPAGGCYGFDLGPEVGGGEIPQFIPAQLTVEREPTDGVPSGCIASSKPATKE